MNIRRCRPLLGTLVEITASLEAHGAGHAQDVSKDSGSALLAAVDAAFAAVERIHHDMSVHDPESELSRVNRLALHEPTQVGEATYDLLSRGLELSREFDGAFDFTIAPLLARWGLVPAYLRRGRCGDWRNVQLLARRQVRFSKPLAIDLGGIAKGRAVDAAIETLRRLNVASCSVNAGGDLRVFGASPSTIHIRHPVHANGMCHAIRLQNAAMATSSPCFSERHWRGCAVSHLIDPRKRSAVTGPVSVTVRAPECWLADALTKVVLNSPKLAEPWLARHDAEAFHVTAL